MTKPALPTTTSIAVAKITKNLSKIEITFTNYMNYENICYK